MPTDHREPGEAFLSITRNETRTKARIREEMRGGARSLHGIAHRSWLTVDETATELREMMTDGWFKMVTTHTGQHLIVPADPGEQLVDPELYSGIISAVGAGADTIEAIAEWLEMECDDTLVFAIGVSLRIAKGWRNG